MRMLVGSTNPKGTKRPRMRARSQRELSNGRAIVKRHKGPRKTSLYNLSLSVSLYFVGLILLRLWLFFYSIFLSFLEQVSPHTLATTICFSREHIFVGFPSLKYWCTVIHHHRPQGPALFRRVRWDFMCVQCVQLHGTSCFKSHPRRLGNVQ